MIHLLNQDMQLLREGLVRECHVMLTDPPYSRHVHSSATSQSSKRGARKREFGFDHLTPDLRRKVAWCAANVQRWSVIYSDVESSTWLRLAATAQGAEYIRTIAWIRWSMPQLSGDRPAQGFEQLLLFWGRNGGHKMWNGSGALVKLDHEHELHEPDEPEPEIGLILDHRCLRGEGKHKAEKPLDQCLDLVSWFSDPDEWVLDPFMGHGTMGRACQLLGRNYIGLEYNPKDTIWFDKAKQRLASPLSDGEKARVKRYLEKQQQESKPDGKAAERAERREADKALVRRLLA